MEENFTWSSHTTFIFSSYLEHCIVSNVHLHSYPVLITECVHLDLLNKLIMLKIFTIAKRKHSTSFWFQKKFFSVVSYFIFFFLFDNKWQHHGQNNYLKQEMCIDHVNLWHNYWWTRFMFLIYELNLKQIYTNTIIDEAVYHILLTIQPLSLVAVFPMRKPL